MSTELVSTVLAQGGSLSTGGITKWLIDNAIPLVLLTVAVLLLWLGGTKGDNAAVMRRLAGVVIALAIIGLAISGAGVNVGQWLSNLFTG